MSRLLLWTSKLLIVSSMNLKIGRLIIIIYVGRGIEILTARCLETTLTWSKGNILHVRNAKSDQVSPIIEIYYINSDQGVKTWSCGLLPWVRLYNPMAVLNCTAKNEALNFFAAFLLYPGIAESPCLWVIKRHRWLFIPSVSARTSNNNPISCLFGVMMSGTSQSR